MIELKHLTTFLGPSIYASEPVVVVAVKVSPQEIGEAARKIALIEAASASWFTWRGEAAPADAAGVCRFLAAWARAVQNEFNACLEVARVFLADGETRIALGYHHPGVSCEAIVLSAKLFADIEKHSAAEVEELLQTYWKICKRHHPDFQAQFLINYARKRAIPYARSAPDPRVWHYGWGVRSEAFFESSPMEDSATGKGWCRDKVRCRKLFVSLGAPIPRGMEVRNESELADAAREVGYPCVVKPSDRGKNLGVTTNIKDWEGLVAAFRAATPHSSAPVLVESHFEGEAYRIMVIRGKLWRATRRARPHVTGDGTSTVLALAEALHAEGMKGQRPGSNWKPAPLDEHFHSALRSQNLRPEDVPPMGATVRVCDIPAMTDGGVYTDVTADVHPDVRAMSLALAAFFGIKVCGFDYITPDIGQSCFGHGVFLEINPTPGLRIPLVAGTAPDEIARAVLGDRPGRIPLVLVIAHRNQHERIRALLPRDHGLGWICGQRAGIGPTEFPDRQPSFRTHLERITRHQTVEAIVVVCGMGNIAAQGMPARRATLTVFIDPESQDPAWTAVLKKHSDRTVEIPDTTRLPDLIASAIADRRDLGPSSRAGDTRPRHPVS